MKIVGGFIHIVVVVVSDGVDMGIHIVVIDIAGGGGGGFVIHVVVVASDCVGIVIHIVTIFIV